MEKLRGLPEVRVFDPALRHFRHGFRVGEPKLLSNEETRWRAAHVEALGIVLEAIAGSPVADQLMLRGSALMGAWFGAAGRRPKDLDFVYVGREKPTDRLRGRLVSIIREAVASGWRGGEPELVAASIVEDEIWLYENAPGRRVVFPWLSGEMPAGAVQVDVVVGEPVPQAPEWVEVTLGGRTAKVLGATKELSLAWKLMWIMSDERLKAKDLYDAGLLARFAKLDRELVDVLFPGAYELAVLKGALVGVEADKFVKGVADDSDLKVDWAEFEKEYSHLATHMDEASIRTELWRRIAPVLEPMISERRAPI